MKMPKTHPSFDEERLCWEQNKTVIGIDEVGRGAFAGPIVAGAVILPANFKIPKKSILSEVNDSKLLKFQMRKKLSLKIKEYSLLWAIEEVDVSTINRIGIGAANKKVLRKVVNKVIANAKRQGFQSFHLLVDGRSVKFIKGVGLKNQKAIVKGDQKSFSIAAASIIAKVHRDSLMKNLHKKFPDYKFSRNKGYGTRKHQEALKLYGLSQIHRTSFDLQKFIS